jgi:GTP-binding protein
MAHQSRLVRVDVASLQLHAIDNGAPRKDKKLRIKRKNAPQSPVEGEMNVNNDNEDNNNNGMDIPDQFSGWVKDEMNEIYDQVESDARELVEDGISGNELPEYMLKILKKFPDEISGNNNNNEPVKQGKLPIIAIVGRPNTGKSTLVNKLTNSYKDGAIVHDEPGITRDRTYRLGTWLEHNFQVVDTGGIVFDDTEDDFAERITQQALTAVEEATLVVMVCDGQMGVTTMDYQLAKWLRRYSKAPRFLAVNKCESQKSGISQAQEFWQLGLGEPYPVSAIHGVGIGELLDEMIANPALEKITDVEKETATNIAFVGRPNVGKSSLFNRFNGLDRAIVSDVAGTTRDTIDSMIIRQRDDGEMKKYRIIDTAGIRKKKKVEYGAEFFMINRAFKAMKRSDCVVLMLDAVSGIVEQDRILAERISDEGRSCIIALNKWDLIPNKDDDSYNKACEHIRSNLPTLKWANIQLVSALTGQRTENLLEEVDDAARQFTRRISTNVLNEVVSDATIWMAPPSIRSRTGKIYYVIQVSAAPPTLVFFCNDPKLFTDNYKRFLERKIRDSLNFEGTPIKMIFRGKQLRDVARVAAKGDKLTKNEPMNDILGMGGVKPKKADGSAVTTGRSPNRKESRSKRGDRNA